ncbi:MAG: NAD(+) synthase [Acidobacteriota bacterium]|nr:NAD(+) synthase [Acidobacteriota bacterium]
MPQVPTPPSAEHRRSDFWEPRSHGFLRVAAAIPHVRVADPAFNAERTVALARLAAAEGAAVVAFPELGLSAYTCDDLFHQQALLGAVTDGLAQVLAASAGLAPVIAVGMPVLAGERLYNCAVVVHRGRVLGAVPKSYLPSYREFYEKRQFAAARDAACSELDLLGERVPFGPDLIFESAEQPRLALHVELCEDLWVPIPPSTYAAMAGANLLVNLSASNITVAKADYRRMLCASHSARTIAAHLYVAAGAGESSTDMAWDGHALIHENGDLIAESERFSPQEHVLYAEVDLERVAQDRLRQTSLSDCASDHRAALRAHRRIEIPALAGPTPAAPGDGEAGARVAFETRRAVERFPYVPHERARRDERCREVYSIQVAGLATRLRAAAIERLVIGVSGGLDSTHALLVAVRAMDELGLPRSNVLAYTMPGFATSAHTLESARTLMSVLGVSGRELDIRPAAEQMLRSIDHPAGSGERVYDTTYENVQAGERTSHLFRLANRHNALVLGTGDLSELALGWCTYGVGDHMSHYAVNASVPKTLIQHLIRWVADTQAVDHGATEVLRAVLETEISPELIPHAVAAEDGPERSASAGGPPPDSERVVGPYELVDFFLYHTLRFGYRPSKVAFLAHAAWHDRLGGSWPELVPEQSRTQYTLAEIKGWLEVFLLRFFATSQFKRSAIPNAPKVGSGGSLSPRGEWRAPSDGSAAPWLEELRRNVP